MSCLPSVVLSNNYGAFCDDLFSNKLESAVGGTFFSAGFSIELVAAVYLKASYGWL